MGVSLQGSVFEHKKTGTGPVYILMDVCEN